MKKKSIALILAAALLIVGVVSGTLAWLTDDTDTITNTFKTSGVTVELTETTGTDYTMIPGYTISKDPTAKVTADSEACWLFVKVEKSANFDTYMEYTMADGWALVQGTTNVYARKVTSELVGTSYAVLKDNKVTVKSTVTNTDMKSIVNTTSPAYPTLKITAYASQLMKDNDTEFTAAQAWANV